MYKETTVYEYTTNAEGRAPRGPVEDPERTRRRPLQGPVGDKASPRTAQNRFFPALERKTDETRLFGGHWADPYSEQQPAQHEGPR